MSFWWLNPLLKRGKVRVLEDSDLPKLQQADCAKTCYSRFMEQLTAQTKKGTSGSPPVLSTIFIWQRKAILLSGLFALIKVLTLATGPLLLKAFIRVAQGKEAFKYEGYALAAGLFVVKCLESLSERQWIFQTRLIGVRVRSMLSAAIYQKQLRLSNAAKAFHSPGQILNYVIVDAYRIGEFPYYFHRIWATSLQLCLALLVIYYCVGKATVASLLAMILIVVGNSPMAKLQHRYLTKLMVAQDIRLKAITEAVTNMKVLKLYGWETNFRNVVEGLRKEEARWIYAILSQRGYYLALFWSSPIVITVVTFWACYLMRIPLDTDSAFTFLATVRIVQEHIRLLPDVAGSFIEAKVALTRILKFLQEPELQKRTAEGNSKELAQSILIKEASFSWDINSSKVTLENIDLNIKPGEKVAICGEVGSGKSTLLAAILGEVSSSKGTVQIYGKVAYVSQTAWIQTGTLQENILFGSLMDQEKYQEVLKRCSLVQDLKILPYGDRTVIGERGVNLSGGQKQRVQLARALYRDADIYLLDDPFSAVDAHTATSLFNEYVMGALSEKTVLLVTHQVDFLPVFDIVLLMSEGKILQADTYQQLLVHSPDFQNLLIVKSDVTNPERRTSYSYRQRPAIFNQEIQEIDVEEELKNGPEDQLIEKEQKETGDSGLKPYIQYLKQNKGFLYLSLSLIFHMLFIVGQLAQGVWLAAELQNPAISFLILNVIYTGIGCVMSVCLLIRSYVVVVLGTKASESIFSKAIVSIFRAPMSYFDSTPVGRILSRLSSDLSIVDLELALKLATSLGSAMNTCLSFAILAVLTWPILFLIIPTVYITIVLQKFYLASANELKRIDGTTKSSVASQLAESIAGAESIRAFKEEDRFISEHFLLIDANSIPYFHSFSANEWLILRLEGLCAVIVSFSALGMTIMPLEASKSGYVGMALAYALSINEFLIYAINMHCMLSNFIISVERLEQCMHIPSEAPEKIEQNQPPPNWPSAGRVVINNLKVKYRPNGPLVLRGISCIFEGGHKIGIVGRTGSGKTTLISALFRLVEPTDGKITIDDIDISKIGLHDIRSQLSIIPQDPTLFSGSVRYNIDPLFEHTDNEIWQVLEKCHLREAVQEKEEGLNSLVVQDGSNWSMGQRQLICLGRALLKRRKILVLDEATASIDNATDTLIQKTIRTEFATCTVITVAHRIPTVIDCTMVLSMKNGEIVEYDEPNKLLNQEGSLFRKLVEEYWSFSGGHNQH
ncbi:ABC-type xenobiotic transporter [Heracleum sosnowskyi]|uniref:ABC-type xenobiotic transporter n=1 Tax=Heracleum sosnowskyi TaxID=360622 RepID=A0AAD8I325_9APIA|nr:ABC-type xenobiotic transporter [Heracleum sosnowskyi]